MIWWEPRFRTPEDRQEAGSRPKRLAYTLKYYATNITQFWLASERQSPTILFSRAVADWHGDGLYCAASWILTCACLGNRVSRKPRKTTYWFFVLSRRRRRSS